MAEYEVVKRPTTKRSASRWDAVADLAAKTVTSGDAISVPLNGDAIGPAKAALLYRIKRLGLIPRIRTDKGNSAIVVWAEAKPK